MVLSSRYFCSHRTMSDSRAKIRSSRSRSLSWRDPMVTPGGWDCLCRGENENLLKRLQNMKICCFRTCFQWYLPVVLSDSSAPAQVVSSVSSPGSLSSRRWTEAEPKRSEASPPSPHMPFSSSVPPRAGDPVHERPPGPPQVFLLWCFAPLLWSAVSAPPALCAPFPDSAPHLK